MPANATFPWCDFSIRRNDSSVEFCRYETLFQILDLDILNPLEYNSLNQKQDVIVLSDQEFAESRGKLVTDHFKDVQFPDKESKLKAYKKYAKDELQQPIYNIPRIGTYASHSEDMHPIH
eukprot:438185_1